MKRILALALVALTLLQCGCVATKLPDDKLPETPLAQEKKAEKVPERIPLAWEREPEYTKLASSGYASAKLPAADCSYIRGGEYADETGDRINKRLNLGEIIFSKTNVTGTEITEANANNNNSFTRHFYLKFDLNGIDLTQYQSAKLVVNYNSLNADADKFFVYRVSGNPDVSALTWNTKQNGTLVTSELRLTSVTPYNFYDLLVWAQKNNSGYLVLRFAQGIYSEGETKIYADEARKPYMLLSSTEGTDSYIRDVFPTDEENNALWAHAEEVYNEWFEHYEQVKKKTYGDSPLIVSDESQYTKIVNSYGSNSKVTKATPQATRTFEALTDMGEYVSLNVDFEYDEYGGIMDPALKQEATGFFYSTKIGDRWWVIDPLGYPCYLRALSNVVIEYSPNSKQKPAALSKFGSEKKWALSTVRRLGDDLGFNFSTSTADEVVEVANGFFYQKATGGFASSYGRKIGVNASVGGSTKFAYSNTMPVFDPDFESFSAEYAAKQTEKYRDDPRVVGYTTDNELPMQPSMLADYLSLDPKVINVIEIDKEETDVYVNAFSYACAWYWLVQQTGKSVPADADITPELKELFRGFVWDRYYSVVCGAMRAVDPNHMLLGTRFLTGVKDAEWVLKFASLYLDCITINWYSAWQPDANDLKDICDYCQLPLMVTEFYAKAKQNEESDKLIHTDASAGWLVDTQADRGAFYQNFTLRLLECKNAVGWHWFQYLDCDPSGTQTDVSSIDSNKGIVSNTHTEYHDLTDRMIEINKNVYTLIEYFDKKYAQ